MCLIKLFSKLAGLYVDIRTYGVVTLNEECGFIQWVPNTVPIRPILTKYYDARRVKSWVSHYIAIRDVCAHLRCQSQGKCLMSSKESKIPHYH